MPGVFISYVRDNQKMVDRLCKDLTTHGAKVWLDRNNITPGKRWKQAIRRAIREGSFFIACFSPKIDTYEKGIMAAREAADSAVIAAVPSQRHQRYAESLLESG